MLDLIAKGGPVMWPIIACAFVSAAIIIERGIYFYCTGINYEIFKNGLIEKLKTAVIHDIDIEKNVSGSKEGFFLKRLMERFSVLRWNRSQYVKTVKVFSENITTGTRSREEALRRTGSEEIEKMERYFQGLSAISHVSPLLGLLGTVTGIIASFNVISQIGGQVDVAALAGGIWEAMLTTAAGLTVAIPTQLAYLYFEKIVAGRVNRMSYTITYMNEVLFSGCPDRGRPCEGTAGEKKDELFTHETDIEEIVKDEVC